MDQEEGHELGEHARAPTVGKTKTVPTSQLPPASPRPEDPPHQRPATDVASPSDPVWRRVLPMYPAMHWRAFVASGGKTGFTGPLGTVRTLYTVMGGSVKPPPATRSDSLPGRDRTQCGKCCQRDTKSPFIVWDHWPCTGFAFIFLTCYRRLGAKRGVAAAAAPHCGMSGAAGPSCREGRSGIPGCALPASGSRIRGDAGVRNRNRCSCVFIVDGFRRTTSAMRNGGPGVRGHPEVPGRAAHRKGRGWRRRPDRRRNGEVGSR